MIAQTRSAWFEIDEIYNHVIEYTYAHVAIDRTFNNSYQTV